MKKIWIVLLVCVLVVGIYAALSEGNGAPKAVATVEPAQPAAGDGEDQEPEQALYGLSGLIAEATDEYIVIADAEQGEVRVNFGEETVFEGVEAGSLAAGRFVYVDYDGKMTRSLPPQVFALRIYAHVVMGTVTAVEEGSVTVDRDGEEIVLHLPEDAPELAIGQRVSAYTNGAATLSLPPQMSADYVTVE